jgi:hypothetical protein
MVNASNEQRGLMEFKGPLPRRQFERTEVMRVEGPSPTGRTVSSSMSGRTGSPALVLAALEHEMRRIDQVGAKVAAQGADRRRREVEGGGRRAVEATRGEEEEACAKTTGGAEGDWGRVGCQAT